MRLRVLRVLVGGSHTGVAKGGRKFFRKVFFFKAIVSDSLGVGVPVHIGQARRYISVKALWRSADDLQLPHWSAQTLLHIRVRRAQRRGPVGIRPPAL